MPDIRRRLGREVLVIDGALGTMLQRYEIPVEQSPAQLNVTAPEILGDIFANYRLAGADCITTNSFGANRIKLAEYGLEDQVEGLNREAVKIARRSGVWHVLADVGPTGLVLEPLGDAAFDHLFEVFAEQISALASGDPDAILIETMTDIAEARCAVLAARSVCDLPVFATCTFGLSGRMDLSGTDPATAAIILEAAGAEAVGLNCGLGPEQLLPLVEEMASATALPLIVQPNAGLPRLEEGETVFPGTADEMGEYAARFVDAGASLVGSCCGSSPSFTGAIADFAQEKQVRTDRVAPDGPVIASPRGHVRIGGKAPLALIGERINPTGKPELADSLREGSTGVVRSYAVAQQHAGAHALDVNVGAAGVDGVEMLSAAVLALSGLSDLPLVLDNTDPAALEAALRVYPGRALVNSVNGAEESLEAILPLAETYGAAVLVLALDDNGIPESVAGRLEVVERVRAAALAAGLDETDLVVDCLTMTAATDPDAAAVTLEATRRVSEEMGLATVLGVSNVSHGLPGRSALNATFLSMAAASGLDAAIVNPDDVAVMTAVKSAGVLRGHDDQAVDWVAWDAALAAAGVSAEPTSVPTAHPSLESQGEESPADSLAAAIAAGDADSAPSLVDALVASGTDPQEIIGEVLTPAIQDLGDRYGRGEVFLPQLMVAADAMKAATQRAKSHLPAGEDSSAGSVVFATVKGDVHSIGKDICISLLESQGYAVSDLGVDVAVDDIVAGAAGSDVVCLSALMTTTLPAMERTVRAVADEASGVEVLVGGAVVTREWAEGVGAGYADDAPGCVAAVHESIAGREAEPA